MDKVVMIQAAMRGFKVRKDNEDIVKAIRKDAPKRTRKWQMVVKI